MSRVIEFRAWNGSQMIEPYSVRNGKAFIIKPCSRDDKVLRDDDGVNYYCNWDVEVSTNYPVMQFTGLTDKNGAEIYEGDILQDSNLTDEAYKSGVYSRGEVVFHDSAFMQCYTHDDGKKYYERINARDLIAGNIYQNPELLK